MDMTGTIHGPCVGCGATDYSLSFGGPIVCPSCDVYGAPGPRERALMQEVKRLRDIIEQTKARKQSGNDVK